MILRTSCEVNRNGWGACERALKLHLSRKGLSGKAKAKTGIGKSDLPGLQGGPRKRDFVLGQSARASALSRPRSESSRQAGNGGYSQGKPTAYRDSSTRRDEDITPTIGLAFG